MNNKKVLIGLPRSGSSWVQQFVDAHNKKYFNTHTIIDQFGGSEFFDENNFTFSINNKQITLLNVDEKINFLEHEKINNRFYSIKIFLDQIYDKQKWFYNFYNDWDIIKLIRENSFDQFISDMVHTPSKKEILIRELNANQNDYILEFLDWHNKLYSFKTNNTLIYENLNHLTLEDMFGVILNKHEIEKKLNNKYDQLFDRYDEVKNIFSKLTVDSN